MNTKIILALMVFGSLQEIEANQPCGPTLTYDLSTQYCLDKRNGKDIQPNLVVCIPGLCLSSTKECVDSSSDLCDISCSSESVIDVQGASCLCTGDRIGSQCDDAPSTSPCYYCEFDEACFVNADGDSACYRSLIPPDDPCPRIDCMHGGTCSAISPTEYACKCVDGYTGTHCEIPPDPCTGIDCMHGGTCSAISSAEYECKCTYLFIGKNCEIPRPRFSC